MVPRLLHFLQEMARTFLLEVACFLVQYFAVFDHLTVVDVQAVEAEFRL